jgi:hypothetical protein
MKAEIYSCLPVEGRLATAVSNSIDEEYFGDDEYLTTKSSLVHFAKSEDICDGKLYFTHACYTYYLVQCLR